MPRFAPVMPLSVARKFKEAGQLGDYHLLLAHDVAVNIREYDELYGDVIDIADVGMPVQSMDDPVIIMDNSVIELGSFIGPGTMLEAVAAVRANVIVLPDMLLDCAGTLRVAEEGLKTYEEARLLAGDAMIVPQGRTFQEWVYCLERLCEYEEIGWIGVPKNLNEKLGISRSKAINAIRMICPHKNVHMLGFSDDLWDDIESTMIGSDFVNCFGIDSAAPLWSGMRDSHMMTLSQNIPGRRGEWMTNPTGDVVRAIENVNLVRQWLYQAEFSLHISQDEESV